MPVNSHTEWGPLREVIVGQAANAYLPRRPGEADLSFRLFHHDNLRKRLKREFNDALHTTPDHVQRIPPREEEERREDVENFVAVLRSLGIRVLRPAPLAQVRPTATPDWSSLSHLAHNVRDQTLVLGDEIIETPPLCRNRYFENDLLKGLFNDYFRRGARWTVAPRPRMLRESFDTSYAAGERQPERTDEGVGWEMMFDAAQCIRFGADVLMNVANENHRLGAVWLQRHVGDRFRIHVVEGLADNHIDNVVMPLRPGVLLVSPQRLHGREHLLPPALRKWDWITCYDTDDTVYAPDKLLLASEYISANVLPLGDDRVVVEESCVGVMRALEKHGFTPVPVRLRHSRVYAGGFHCITLDTVRDDGPEHYLV